MFYPWSSVKIRAIRVLFSETKHFLSHAEKENPDFI